MIGIIAKSQLIEMEKAMKECVLFILILVTMCQIISGQKPEIVVQTGHTSSIDSIAFSLDARYIASGSNDKTVKIWDIETKTVIRTFSGHSNSVDLLAFSPDGKILASNAVLDNKIKLWNVQTGLEIKTLQGHLVLLDQLFFLQIVKIWQAQVMME